MGELGRLPGLGCAPGLDNLGFRGLGLRTRREEIGVFLGRAGHEPQIGIIWPFGRLPVVQRHPVIVQVYRRPPIHTCIISDECT
jgi:hypothetical protein